MVKQSDARLCNVYITHDERRLLAKVAQGRGVGRDYIALCAHTAAAPAVAGRPIPRWLGQQKPTARASRPRKQHAPAQARHCRSCARLLIMMQPDGKRCCRCAAGIWTHTLQERSLKTSRLVRRLSLACASYQAVGRREQPAPHHCRACRELAEADTVDQRFVCTHSLWTNPMKPQSVANSRRLTRLSAACRFFAPRSGGWIPRS